MDKKQCSKCGEIQNVSSFSKRKESKDGYRGVCKSCKSTPEIRKKRSEWVKADRKAHPEKYKQRDKAKYDKHRPQILERKKVYYIDNKEVISERKKAHYEINKDAILEANKEYRKNNQESILTNKREYEFKRRHNDPLYKLTRFQRDSLGRIIKAIKYNKDRSSTEYLGCSVEFLKNYIESQWEYGMNWSNRTQNGWHIDHIVPLFTAKTEEDVFKLCHYTNLQPLWAEDHIAKTISDLKKYKILDT
jgi:hypothetical protein